MAASARRLSAVHRHTRAQPASGLEVPVDQQPSPDRYYIELSGTPFERGQTHGRELASEIEELFGVWRQQMFSLFGDGEADDPEGAQAWMNGWSTAFVASTDFEVAIDRWAPGLLEEVRGMAQATGIRYDEMLTFQLMDEYWFHGKGIADAWQCDPPPPPALPPPPPRLTSGSSGAGRARPRRNTALRSRWRPTNPLAPPQSPPRPWTSRVSAMVTRQFSGSAALRRMSRSS